MNLYNTIYYTGVIYYSLYTGFVCYHVCILYIEYKLLTKK